TFNVELDSKTNKNGEKLIMIRVTQNGAHKRINTGICINSAHWDKKKKLVQKKYPLADEINATIAAKLNKLMEVYLQQLRQDGITSLHALCNQFAKPKALNFFEFAKTFKLNYFAANGKLGTLRRYESVLTKLKLFTGAQLGITAIDYTLLKEYEGYLLKEKKN